MYKFPIAEIFESIQGEGIHVGKSANFIRFAGCNRECEWCDTDHTEKMKLSLEDILSKVNFENAMTVLTGGEPLIHEGISVLIKELRKMKLVKNSRHIVAIETNGTLPTFGLEVDWVTASPKPPEYTLHNDCIPFELKYVVDETLSLEDIIHERVPKGHIWLQPNAKDAEKSIEKAMSLLREDNTLRLGMQLHKFYELP
jgi:7-carboxy-7-deazaguanine synthase